MSAVRAGPLLAALVACSSSETTATTTATATVSAPPAGDARVTALLRAEATRNPGGIESEDLQHRDVAVRRAAMRALARIREPELRPKLQRGLRDEDAVVRAWAAYGLGDVCAGAREATVRAIVAAAVAHEGRGEAEADHLAPLRAMARALGRCGTASAEATLVAWLDGPHADDAIDALGDLARTGRRLREETYVALLQHAEGDAEHPPRGHALYPLGQVQYLTPSVIERAQKVAGARLEDDEVDGPVASYALRTLARCGDDAMPALVQAMNQPALPVVARLEAIDSMSRFADAGQRALGKTLVAMLPGTKTMVAAKTPPEALHLPLAVLARLRRIREAKAALEELSGLPAPDGATDAQKRRVSLLRCRAAHLLVERNYDDPRLKACDLLGAEDAADPRTDLIGGQARLEAIGIDAVKLRGARLETWKAYATGGVPALRAMAIRQLLVHDEVQDSSSVLHAALTADAPGVVAAAAEVIAQRPGRVGGIGKLDPAVAKALLEGLEGKGATADQEALSAVIDTASKLGLEAAKPAFVRLCGSPWPALREHAQAALERLAGKGGAVPTCRATSPRAAPPELDGSPLSGPVTITFKTSVGDLSMTLYPRLAPITSRRVVSLVENDHYDGMIVHRVVPGFVAQFGSPTGDGYGGVEGLPALPCETSPLRFDTQRVGVALAGRDTGSSQLFVTLANKPHLDGSYAWLGTAEGPWTTLVPGDRIEDAAVSGPPHSKRGQVP